MIRQSFLLSNSMGSNQLRRRSAFLKSTFLHSFSAMFIALSFVIFVLPQVVHATNNYVFSGILTDGSNSVVPNATINLLTSSGVTVGSVATSSSGSFSITATPGLYKLYITGSNTAGMSSFSLRQTSASIDLTSGNVTKNLQIPTTSVSYTVYNAAGLPKTGYITVYASASGGSASLYPGDTGETIAVTNSGVTSGKITTIVGATYIARGMNESTYSGSICEYLPTTKWNCMNTPLTVTGPGQHVDIALASVFHTFSGTLTDGSGNPVANTTVTLSTDTDSSPKATTDSSGNFSITAASGQYKLSIAGTNTAGMSSFSLGQATAGIDLTNGNLVQNLQIPTTTVSYTVYNNAGLPKAGYITVYASASGGTAGLYPGDVGETIKSIINGGITSGKITTIVGAAYITKGMNESSYNGSICEYLPTTKWNCMGTPLVVTGSGHHVDIALASVFHTFSGTLTDGSGNPVPNATITLTYTDSSSKATTDSSGNFSITAAPGLYGMSITGSNTAGMSSFTLRQATASIDLTSGNVTQNMRIPTTNLSYTVYDNAGLPKTGYITVYANTSGGTTSLYPGDVGETIAVTNGGITSGNITTIVGATYIAKGMNESSYNGSICEYLPTTKWNCMSTPLTVTGPTHIGIPQTPPPTIPTGFSVQSPTQYPHLSWNTVSIATSYNIYRDGSIIGSVTGTTYTDNNVPEGAYVYFVTAVNNGVESGHSNSVNVLVDRTKPTVSYTITPTPNENGWNNTSVTVTFYCSDNGSGIRLCSNPVVIDGEGAGQTATGTATDNAGNSSTVTAVVNIDGGSQTITPVVSTPPNNNGWNNNEVTITFNCNNTLSGIESCTNPATFTDDGTYELTGTVVDSAGNTSTVTVVVNIDKTAPTIAYTVSPVPNSNGWNNGDVIVTFICGDVLSGIESCSDPITVSSEGANLITGTAIDKAGNVSTVNITVSIDKTTPNINADTSGTPNTNGWNNVDTTVSFTCGDNISGVDSCSDPITLSEGAGQVITGTAVDKAGNSSSTSSTFNIDKTAPTINYSISSVPNSNGWNNGEVVVTFNCGDALSGVASCTDPVTLSDDGTFVVTGTAVDNAGNITSINVIVSVDQVAPTIASNPSSQPNQHGWYNGDTTISFNCSDNLSGIDNCSDPVTLSEGAGQIVTGTAVDQAGNSSSTSMSVDIDKTAPTIGYSLSQSPNVSGWNNSNVTITFSCSDALSGVASCTDPITLTENGTYVVTGTAMDNAGNVISTNVIVKISKTPPAAGIPVWSVNPSPLGSNTTLTVPVVDGIENLIRAEYFINADPGVGSGVAMTINGSNLSATFGASLPTGYYTIGMRLLDAAGNWSETTYAYLVVYNPNGPTEISGSKSFVPTLAGGDVLPGLISANQNDRASMSFDVSYGADGTVSSISRFGFTYSTGQACNSVNYFNCYNTGITTISINNLTFVGTNYSEGVFEGVGTLMINGVVTQVTFIVEARDGKLIGNRIPDTFAMKIYSAGVNPNESGAIPLYQVTTSLTGNGVVVS